MAISLRLATSSLRIGAGAGVDVSSGMTARSSQGAGDSARLNVAILENEGGGTHAFSTVEVPASLMYRDTQISTNLPR